MSQMIANQLAEIQSLAINLSLYLIIKVLRLLLPKPHRNSRLGEARKARFRLPGILAPLATLLFLYIVRAVVKVVKWTVHQNATLQKRKQ